MSDTYDPSNWGGNHPVAYLCLEDPMDIRFRDCSDSNSPPFGLPLAERTRPARAEVENTTINRQLRQPYRVPIMNGIRKMPTHVLRTSDMKLMNRANVWDELQPFLKQLEAGGYDVMKLQKLTRFAILSHRWGDIDSEPTFQDMWGEPDYQKLRETHRVGFDKLEKFCQIALMYGCHWAWADTCCIDKTSSAELDEAIRSMYRWYSDAVICIVHLADTVYLDDMKDDAWFTRGWTLQELLAPRRIKFFNSGWLPLTSDLNDKDQKSTLLQSLSEITTIPPADITDFRVGTDRTGEKMCWAARRTTTRIEDNAYSLIGIFDVSMVIMYGEGERAFYRLQLAIAELTRSIELFLWTGSPSHTNSMLAREPASFGVPLADEQIPVELTADEWEQLSSYTIAATGEGFGEMDHFEAERMNREIQELGEDRETEIPDVGGQDGSWVTQQTLQRWLECLGAETVRQLGQELWQRMDGRVLRQIWPRLVETYPELEDLLDQCTLDRLRSSGRMLPLISLGGSQYAMTGAGLAIDVVLYDVRLDTAADVDPDAPLRIHNSEQDTYVITSAHYYMPPDTKLAVIDYYWVDTSHNPDKLHNSLDSNTVIREIETYLYRGVWILPTDGGSDCFERIQPTRDGTRRPSALKISNRNMNLVKRPEDGWNTPQRIYIR